MGRAELGLAAIECGTWDSGDADGRGVRVSQLDERARRRYLGQPGDYTLDVSRDHRRQTVRRHYGARGRWGSRLLVVWTIGLSLGAIDLLGFLAALGVTLCCAWFIAATGVLISLDAKNGTRALLATFLVMFVTGWVWPRLLWESLVSRNDLAMLRRARPRRQFGDWQCSGQRPD